MRLLWLLGVGLFLALIFWLVQAKEPYFWYSAHDFYERAQDAEARGAKTEALEWARQAYRREPKDANYGSFLGWRYLETGQPQAALQIFRQVCELQPQATAAFKGQAQALDQLGERPAALALLDSFLSDSPDNWEILQFAADLAGRQASNRPQALNYYRRLYKLNPTDTSVRRQLLNLLLAAGNFAEAIPVQEAETADFPDDPAALHQLALLHYWQQDYQAAVPIYQRLLEIEAENQALRLEAAKTADAAHEVDKALSHYLRLYTREPYNKEYAIPLARLWSQKGNHTEAATVLASLMKDRPDAELRRQYALEHLLAGDYSHAYRAYRAAWEAGDTHQETILNLARLAAQQRHFHVAAQFWDEARRRQLVRRELSWEAALTYSYAQRYPEAVEVLKASDRQEPQVLLFLGQMHFYQKHWGQAAHYYRTYLEKYPHEVKVRAQLAEVLSYDPETLGESTQQLAATLKEQDDPRQRLKLAALLLEQAQALSEDKKPGHREEAGKKWAEAEAELQKFQDKPGEPELRREAAHLYLWLGDLDKALEYYEQYLSRNQTDRQAHLEKARVLIYLQRGREAMEVLRRLPASKSPGSTEASESKENNGATSDSPENGVTQKQVLDQSDDSGADREMLVVAVEAALAVKDWRQADQWAFKLFSLQLTDKPRLPRDWPEAIRRVRQEKTPQPLSLEERTWIARTLAHQPDLEHHQELVREAISLISDNLRAQGIQQSSQRRTYQANLLLLAYLLPRLTHYDDLQAMINRLPGIKEDSPEYIAALSYFSEKQGRQGGKLDYLLHFLKERRHRHVPRLPADLIHLAGLAAELGDQPSALHYCNLALQMRPRDQRLQAMRMQVLMARHDWGEVLKTLESGPHTPATALKMANIYMQRQQYEGAVAVLSNLLQNNPSQPEAMLLLAQSYRSLGDNQQALQTLTRLETQGQTSESVLMAKAQVLEAMDDRRGSQTAYEQVIQQAPDAQTAKVAQARLDRSRGNWAAAYQHLAQALANAPQDIELLNELEYIRGQMRPHREARNLPYWRGERRPEEKFRPWQFGRYDREPGVQGGSRGYSTTFLGVHLPDALRPETTVFSDSNNLRGLEARLSGGFWLGKVLPINMAVEYRQYQQKNTFFSGPSYNLGLARVFSQSNYVASRLRRAEISLGAGPLSLGDRVKISGEVIGRRYWKEVKRRIGQQGQVGLPVLTSVTVQNNFLVDYNYQSQGFNAKARGRSTEKDQANRLLGSMSLDIRAGHSTDIALKYSRRDLFDQDSNIYPRLYQSVLNLAQTRFTILNQMELSYNHQFKPGLDWRGSLGGALYSDQNQRLTFYQGLRWQVVKQPRMHLDLTPHYYLATYSQRRQAYFSPREYQAFGLGLDFDRQLFRLPTLILQGTFQMVDNQGRWGPALQGVIGLEQELLQNFFTGVHFFYFREFVDNYRLTSVSVGLRWLF